MSVLTEPLVRRAGNQEEVKTETTESADLVQSQLEMTLNEMRLTNEDLLQQNTHL